MLYFPKGAPHATTCEIELGSELRRDAGAHEAVLQLAQSYLCNFIASSLLASLAFLHCCLVGRFAVLRGASTPPLRGVGSCLKLSPLPLSTCVKCHGRLLFGAQRSEVFACVNCFLGGGNRS